MPEQEEQLEIVDERGNIIGLAQRSEVHADPTLIHRVVHALVFSPDGELLLQKRSLNKDVAPGKWDTSVGGHVGVGEEPSRSVEREMEEELGIVCPGAEYLYTYLYSSPYETELVTTYRCTYAGEFYINREEIDEARYWRLEEIRDAMGKGILSDHFEHEFRTYLNHGGSK